MFSGQAWLIYRAGCRGSTLRLKILLLLLLHLQKRHVHFPNLGDVRMANHWAPCHYGKRHWHSLSLDDVCKAQTYLFRWCPLQCDVNRNKLPGGSLKSNCGCELTWPSKSHLLRTWGRSQTFAEVSRDRIKQGVIELCLYKLKIKIPAIYTRFYFFFVVICQYSKSERVRKGHDTKTRWNRARYSSNPIITLILLPFYRTIAIFLSNLSEGPMMSTRDPSAVTFFFPTLPSLQNSHRKRTRKYMELSALILFSIDLLTNVQQSLFLYCTVSIQLWTLSRCGSPGVSKYKYINLNYPLHRAFDSAVVGTPPPKPEARVRFSAELAKGRHGVGARGRESVLGRGGGGLVWRESGEWGVGSGEWGVGGKGRRGERVGGEGRQGRRGG